MNAQKGMLQKPMYNIPFVYRHEGFQKRMHSP